MTRAEYVPDKLDKNSQIAKEGYYNRKAKENDLQRKLHEMAESDEHKKINKHNEGFCYGCNRRDYVISSLFYACTKCMHKRGTEALLAVVFHKPAEEVCDFCGRWQKPFDTFQINCSMCNSCMGKVHKMHEDYKKAGGAEQNPFTRKMKKKFGKDYKILQSQGARKVNI